MLDVLPLISGRQEWRSMSQAAHDRPEDGSQLGPADPRLRDRVIAELRRRQAQATTLELAAHYERLATRAERAAEVHASPASPWTAATTEERTSGGR
jgi:hypothetical protein